MSDTPSPGVPSAGDVPPAHFRRPRFSLVWIIPIVAVVLAAYLVYKTESAKGPLLELNFKTATGLAVDQTQIKYKDLVIGTVEDLNLSDDNSHIIVKVRMTAVGGRFLNSRARFWVVKPNFSLNSISGLDTLISGSYIAVDPGLPGGHRQSSFTGLEAPPGVQSDEPGSTYTLQTKRVGSLSAGVPVFFNDVEVGEVLGYDIGDGTGPVTVSIFIKAPFDRLVKPQSHFWNASGLSVGIQNGEFHVVFQSLAAVLGGGVSFDFPPGGQNIPPSPDNSVFPLYPSEDAANVAGYTRRLEIVTYFTSSVDGLTPGAAVNILGMQVGQVKTVTLLFNPNTGAAKVRVSMELQPERLFKNRVFLTNANPFTTLQNLVNQGLRVQLATGSYITGQQVVNLIHVPDTKPVQISMEGNAIVIPAQPGAFDNIMASLTKTSDQLSKIPFAEIGQNLNTLLISTNGTVSSPALKQSLVSLAQTLSTTNTTLIGLDQSYGSDSDFQRSLEQLMQQANSTLRSVDMFTSYLNRQPQSLLLGRSKP